MYAILYIYIITVYTPHTSTSPASASAFASQGPMSSNPTWICSQLRAVFSEATGWIVRIWGGR